MSNIHFDLTNSANLQGMAPAPIPGGGFANAVLPNGMAMAGSYIIVNTNSNNRYIGISGNIANRFNTRLATVTEMGFAVATMANIGVIWGNTHCRDSAPGSPWQIAIPAPPAAYEFQIDNVLVNLERLLIRFVITQLGVGGTVSNNAMAANPYTNPTQSPINVQLSWGNMGGLFNPGQQNAVWGIGQNNAW